MPASKPEESRWQHKTSAGGNHTIDRQERSKPVSASPPSLPPPPPPPPRRQQRDACDVVGSASTFAKRHLGKHRGCWPSASVTSRRRMPKIGRGLGCRSIAHCPPLMSRDFRPFLLVCFLVVFDFRPIFRTCLRKMHPFYLSFDSLGLGSTHLNLLALA